MAIPDQYSIERTIQRWYAETDLVDLVPADRFLTGQAQTDTEWPYIIMGTELADVSGSNTDHYYLANCIFIVVDKSHDVSRNIAEKLIEVFNHQARKGVEVEEPTISAMIFSDMTKQQDEKDLWGHLVLFTVNYAKPRV